MCNGTESMVMYEQLRWAYRG